MKGYTKSRHFGPRGKMTANIEMFNQVVGLIFDQLYRSFPLAEQMDYEAMAAKVGVEARDYHPPAGVISTRMREYGDVLDGMNFESFVDQAVAFLVAEAFLQQDRYEYRLSARALTILNAPITGLDESLGKKLTGAVKEAGTEAGRAAISETVGQIIGATARGFFANG